MQRIAASRQFSSWLGQNWTNSALKEGSRDLGSFAQSPTTGNSAQNIDPFRASRTEAGPSPGLEDKFAKEARENRGQQTNSPGARGAEYPTEGKKLVEEAKETFKEAKEKPGVILEKAKDFVKRTTGWGVESRLKDERKPFT